MLRITLFMSLLLTLATSSWAKTESQALSNDAVARAVDATLQIQKAYDEPELEWETNRDNPELPRIVKSHGFESVSDYFNVVSRIRDVYLNHFYDKGQKTDADVKKYIADIEANTALDEKTKTKLINMQKRFVEIKKQKNRVTSLDLPAIEANIEGVKKAFDIPRRKCKGNCTPHGHGHHGHHGHH